MEKVKLSVEKWSKERKAEVSAKKVRLGDKNGMYGVHRHGKDNPMYGKTQSDSCKAKISKTNKGTIVVKDNITGIIVGRVSINDPKFLSGEWVGIQAGKKASLETCLKLSAIHKLNGNKPPSPAGKLWWNNGIKNYRSTIPPEGNNWIRGRLSWKNNG